MTFSKLSQYRLKNRVRVSQPFSVDIQYHTNQPYNGSEFPDHNHPDAIHLYNITLLACASLMGLPVEIDVDEDTVIETRISGRKIVSMIKNN